MSWTSELKKYRWAIALVCVVISGYTVGKDAAMRDNARDTQAQFGGNS